MGIILVFGGNLTPVLCVQLRDDFPDLFHDRRAHPTMSAGDSGLMLATYSD
jgi:hypothetical protein